MILSNPIDQLQRTIYHRSKHLGRLISTPTYKTKFVGKNYS